MIKNTLALNFKDNIGAFPAKSDLLFGTTKLETCPNCGNTRPIFQHVQNGMIVCFICRKASFNVKDNISAW